MLPPHKRGRGKEGSPTDWPKYSAQLSGLLRQVLLTVTHPCRSILSGRGYSSVSIESVRTHQRALGLEVVDVIG
jgi:hypothetical protein